MKQKNERLQKLIKKDGRTQSQLAADIDVTAPTLSHWIHRRRKPGAEDLKKLAEELGASCLADLGYAEGTKRVLLHLD